MKVKTTIITLFTLLSFTSAQAFTLGVNIDNESSATCQIEIKHDGWFNHEDSTAELKTGDQFLTDIESGLLPQSITADLVISCDNEGYYHEIFYVTKDKKITNLLEPARGIQVENSSSIACKDNHDVCQSFTIRDVDNSDKTPVEEPKTDDTDTNDVDTDSSDNSES